ncbi:MAG TPA: VOC family protein [Candidatus Binatia bacterium]|nr:VOC family protein [Candidatus Binatia bacterium]
MSSPSVPNLRVDHVSIAVRSIDRALDFFLEHFPALPNEPKQPGYGERPEFCWTDFTIGGFKVELIESARPASFVERFLAKRGEGFHHLSFEIANLDLQLERLEADGARIVDHFDGGEGHKTAFVHPRSAFGTLIQFWERREDGAFEVPSCGGTVVKDGVRWQVDHLSLALERIDAAVLFFERHFAGRVEVEPHLAYDQRVRLLQMRLRDYRLELMEAVRPESFLARFLSRRGEGMHHLSINVEDLDAALAPFERAGFAIVGRVDFAPGRRAAFLHPRSAFGVLIQLWQAPVEDWYQGLALAP